MGATNAIEKQVGKGTVPSSPLSYSASCYYGGTSLENPSESKSQNAPGEGKFPFVNYVVFYMLDVFP